MLPLICNKKSRINNNNSTRIKSSHQLDLELCPVQFFSKLSRDTMLLGLVFNGVFKLELTTSIWLTFMITESFLDIGLFWLSTLFS